MENAKSGEEGKDQTVEGNTESSTLAYKTRRGETRASKWNGKWADKAVCGWKNDNGSNGRVVEST